jgi:KUP system potassium uptake protein
MRRCTARGLKLEASTTSFYVGRETFVPAERSTFAPWRRALFRFLSRNAASATDFFAIPANRVVEIGAQIDF